MSWNLPPMARLEDARRAWRREEDAESCRETALNLSSGWLDTACLLWGDVLAAAIANSTAPTALRMGA